jgi:hypothetical protein
MYVTLTNIYRLRKTKLCIYNIDNIIFFADHMYLKVKIFVIKLSEIKRV